MDQNSLEISCQQWRETVEDHPQEMQVVMEMLIEAEAEICEDVEGRRY